MWAEPGQQKELQDCICERQRCPSPHLGVVMKRAATHPRILFLYHKMAPTTSKASNSINSTGMITENASVYRENTLANAPVVPPTSMMMIYTHTTHTLTARGVSWACRIGSELTAKANPAWRTPASTHTDTCMRNGKIKSLATSYDQPYDGLFTHCWNSSKQMQTVWCVRPFRLLSY